MSKKESIKFEFEPIGYVQSPFKDKFGIPRQPGLASEARGVIKIGSDPNLKTALKSFEEFSHLWIVFVFHAHGGRNWKPSIRPPRLGGSRKVGVLASRSPHRPNPIGLSAVALERVDLDALGGPEIHVRGIDLLDKTPVLDIKPYIPYADSIPTANAGWASEPMIRIPIEFTSEAEVAISLRATGENSNLRAMIVEILELDPRPAFQKRNLPPESASAHGTRYGFALLNCDVKYEIREGKFLVYNILNLEEGLKK